LPALRGYRAVRSAVLCYEVEFGGQRQEVRPAIAETARPHVEFALT
jgi:hypothetical protein